MNRIALMDAVKNAFISFIHQKQRLHQESMIAPIWQISIHVNIRLNEELRRRERVIRIFPNDQNLIRLMSAVLMEIHEKWINGKKYFNMDCYFEERDETRRQALAQRAEHLQVVK